MKRVAFVLCVVLMMISCKSEYEQLVSSEASKGVRYDSLLFDIKIGDSRMDFYEKCWKLNAKQKITNGTGNRSARFQIQGDSLSETPQNIDVLFYAIIDEKDIVQGMEMTCSYVAWAPWNTDLHADKLALHLKDYIEEHYGGNNFIDIKDQALPEATFVKVDGNRRILMYPLNDKDLKVLMEDMTFVMSRNNNK